MRMLLKRWWFWGGIGLILVAVVAGYLLIPIKEDPLSRATYEKIQLGMTVAQVKELTGLGQKFDKLIDVNWGDEEGTYTVQFDGLVVTGKTFTPSNLPLTERIKRRIERRIKALWP